MSLLSNAPVTDTNNLYSSISSTSIDQSKSEEKASNKEKLASPINGLPSRIVIIQGIFLLIVAVSGNFVAETMGCQTQKILSENMYVKNAVIILIVYFSLGFASSEHNTSPINILKQSLLIWSFFLMFNKMEIFFSAMVVAMLIVLLICKDYIAYYERDDKDKHMKTINTLSQTMDYLFYSVMITTIVGFGMYFKKQRSDYFSTFSYSTFLFGSPKCSNF